MWNLIKSQKYKIVGDNFIIYGMIIALAINFLAVVSEISSFGGLSGSAFAVLLFSFLPFTLAIVSIVVATRVMGWDMNDNTINYEIMSGHSRYKVFFARVIFGIIASVSAAVIIVVVPLLLVTAICGWGKFADFGEIMTRLAVLLVPYIRWTCELMLVTVLVKNSNAGMLIGYMVFLVSTMFVTFFEEITEKDVSTWFISSEVIKLTSSLNSRMELIGEDVYTVYDFSLGSDVIKSSIISSIIVGVLCIILSVVVFKKRDM